MSDPSFLPVDPETFRRGMRHVPTVVTVVTFDAQEAPCGVTIGSFVSLSLEPPLICFNIKKDSDIHDEIVAAERYLVHVLCDDQAAVSDRFADPARSTRAMLDGTDTEEGPHGIPTLKRFLVRFDCGRTAIHDGGDHSIILACVEGIAEGAAARPIVYHQRAYWAVGPQVADRKQT
ncbi:MAG: flavin reductase family protein [Bacteroidetes bacterium]|nr:flavin reductase family protein [Bacteroidota bacterium]MDA0875460.1 flavin reductase family protein [Bacteroidota bacterium]